MGGNPGAVGETHYRRGSSVLEDLAAGRMPEKLDQLGGEKVQTFGKGDALPVPAEDAIEWNWSGSGGFGDPLTREPESVLSDRRANLITAAAVFEDYGVVLDGDAVDGDAVDVEATIDLRATRRRDRLAAAGASTEVPRELAGSIPEGKQAIADDIWVDEEAGTYRCAHCGEATGTRDGHSTSELISHEMELPELSSRYPDPTIWVDAEAVWREFYCKGCGTRLAGEIARPTDPPIAGCRLDLR
jgi:N-methylhydantoinase B